MKQLAPCLTRIQVAVFKYHNSSGRWKKEIKFKHTGNTGTQVPRRWSHYQVTSLHELRRTETKSPALYLRTQAAGSESIRSRQILLQSEY